MSPSTRLHRSSRSRPPVTERDRPSHGPVTSDGPTINDDPTASDGMTISDGPTASHGTSSGPVGEPPASKRPRHPIAGGFVTVLAVLLVMFALIAPNRLEHLTPAGFLRIPIEALLVITLYLVVPATRGRAGRVLAVLIGFGLGLLTIVKLLDIGFYETFNRPFDALLDFPLAGNGIDFLTDSIGRAGALAVTAGIGLLIVAIPVLMILSVRRLIPLVLRHRIAAGRSVAVLAVAWAVLAALGAQLVPYTPVASGSAAAIAISHVRQVPTDLADARTFDRQARVDAFRDTPGNQLLTSLRGKDVVVAFVESYGRSAIESPDMAPKVDAVLDEGTRRLKAAGFASRSGFLTSPTAGGGSWLAQATLMSGLWVKNQSLYEKFVASDRLTLNGAFRRADWRTLAVAPGVKKDWPESRVYGFDKIYAARDLGYQGPHFSWSWMPDQYVLSTFERTEHGKAHAPMMAEIPLTSSHMPWTPLPHMIDWNAVGNGSVFTPMATHSASTSSLYGDEATVRARYTQSVQYTLSALISYVQTYGDKNLVLVFLGDHQPMPLVAGRGASHDVPITIVAKDPAVLSRTDSWGWQDGLRPGPNAPVWRMDTFRDRFLTTFK